MLPFRRLFVRFRGVTGAFALLLAVAVPSGDVFAADAVPEASPAPGPSGIPAEAPAPSPVPPAPAAVAPSIPGEKIPRSEVRAIRRRFAATLDAEGDALRREQKRIRQTGKTSRKARRREWDQAEKASRRRFFDENVKGPDRRKYVQEFNERRKAFYESLKAEERAESDALGARRNTQKEVQKSRLNAVEEYLRRAERPPGELLAPLP